MRRNLLGKTYSTQILSPKRAHGRKFPGRNGSCYAWFRAKAKRRPLNVRPGAANTASGGGRLGGRQDFHGFGMDGDLDVAVEPLVSPSIEASRPR